MQATLPPKTANFAITNAHWQTYKTTTQIIISNFNTTKKNKMNRKTIQSILNTIQKRNFSSQHFTTLAQLDKAMTTNVDHRFIPSLPINLNDKKQQIKPSPVVQAYREAILADKYDLGSTYGKHTSRKCSQTDLSVVYSYSKNPTTDLSLSTMLKFAEHNSITSLIVSSGWLYDELKCRLAKQIYLLDNMPLGLNIMPSIR